MKKGSDSSWKHVSQFRHEEKKRIVAQTVTAPSLLSANAEILRLTRQLREDASKRDSMLRGIEEYTVS